MFKRHFKQILIVFLLFFLIVSIWLLNQKKNFNPVLSLKTNLSFKSQKDLNYKDLSSNTEVLKTLNKKFPDFKLNPSIRDRDFSVIGRVFEDGIQEVIVFEYPNSANAKKDLEKFKSKYNSKMFLYKNLIILTGLENDVLSYLKENLK